MGDDVTDGTLAERAARALALIGEDPRVGLAAADAVIATAPTRVPVADAAAVAVAHRAAGLALRELGEPVEAERRLRRAVALADRAGDDVTAAEARMTLAYVLLERGRMRAALAAADRAAPALSGVRAARLRAQRGLVLQRCGRDAEALTEYAKALPALARAGDEVWESRLRNNRALLRAYLGDTAGGISDLRRAHELELAAGRRAYAADRLCNLAWLQGVAGNVADALATFDRVEREAADVAPPERWVDRAEVLLRAGLVDDARRVAGAAVAWLAGRGWEALSAEAMLLLATCDLRAGDDAAAVEHARAARDLLLGQGRRGWSVLADEVAVRARMRQADAEDRPAATTAAVRVAAALDDAGWPGRADDLRLAVARTADGPLAVLGPVAARAPRGGPAERARPLFARALLRADDDPARARLLQRAWHAAEAQRWTVGAAELRAVAAPLSVDVVAVGVDSAWRRGSAARTFRWAERGRSALLRLPAVRAPRDADLAAALGMLRLAVRDEEAARLTGADASAAAGRRAALEQQVVALSRHAAGRRGADPVGVAQVRARLGDRVFVHFVSTGGRLGAVAVSPRRTTLHDLGAVGEVAAAVASVGFSLRRAAGGHGGAAAALAAVHRGRLAAERLDELLLRPLRGPLGDRAAVVCPTGVLGEVPWAWLPTMRGRPVSVAPSATSWVSAGERPRRGHGLLAVAGPGLPAARREAADVAAGRPDALLLADDAATVAAVSASLAEVDVAHLAAHGRLRADNPLFSTIELADGPLTGYDLERLPHVPRTVLLPACRSGVGRAPLADETLGLAWTLLGAGAANIVATVAPVADEATHGLMLAVHERLAEGLPVASALAAAQDAVAGVGGPDPVVEGTAAAFVCYGA